jgi:hypothetical protein
LHRIRVVAGQTWNGLGKLLPAWFAILLLAISYWAGVRLWAILQRPPNPLRPPNLDSISISEVRWETFHQVLAGLLAMVPTAIAIALLYGRRLRRGLGRWWTNWENSRSLIDTLAKTGAVVGVFAAIDILTLSPRVAHTFSCKTLVNTNEVLDEYRRSETTAPTELILALHAWEVDENVATSNAPDNTLPLYCALDSNFNKLQSALDAIPDESTRELAQLRVTQHSYQFVVVSATNFGRGSADDLHIVVPVEFTLDQGPGSPFDMPQGTTVGWTMRSKEGSITHIPFPQVEFDSAHEPDYLLYAAALVLIWGIFVVPSLVKAFREMGGAPGRPGAPAHLVHSKRGRRDGQRRASRRDGTQAL